jgi:hypothetical protein
MQVFFTITFATLAAIILSNSGLLTNVSHAVSLSHTTQLPAVKITSPPKSQQVIASGDILVSGISLPPKGVSHTRCTVSVLLNDAKPYQKTVATGPIILYGTMKLRLNMHPSSMDKIK